MSILPEKLQFLLQVSCLTLLANIAGIVFCTSVLAIAMYKPNFRAKRIIM